MIKSVKIVTVIALIIGLVWTWPTKVHAINPAPAYIDGNTGDSSITVHAFDWSSLQGQTYSWWSQQTIDDYILNNTQLPDFNESITLVFKDGNGVWRLNLPWPESLIPDTPFTDSSWYFFYYPPFNWGRWVNSVGWLYTFVTAAIEEDPAVDNINQYIYNFEPWLGGSNDDGLLVNDWAAYDEYVGRKTRLNKFMYGPDDPNDFVYPFWVDNLVFNLGFPNFDTEHIQWALDNVASGGQVILKGDFSFLPGFYSGGVAPTQSVEITGNDAVIRGGSNTFITGPLPFDPGMDVTIRDLTIEEFSSTGIFILSSPNSVPYGDIIIHNVTLKGARANRLGRFGILIEGRQYPSAFPGWPPLVADSIRITDCHIDLIGEDGSSSIVPYTANDNWKGGQGIVIEEGIGTEEQPVNILVHGNTVRNTSLLGISVFNISGTVVLEYNHIRPGPIGMMVDGYSVGSSGMITVQSLDIWGWGYPGEYARYTISDNTIEKEHTTRADGSTDYTTDTFVMGSNATQGTVVRNNLMTSAQGIERGSFLFFNSISDADIRDNTCSGTAFVGINLPGNPRNNVLKRNDLSGLLTNLAQIWLRGEGNSLKNNDIGPPGQWGGIGVLGADNQLVNNTFHGDYPGWSVEFGPDESPFEKGCIVFGSSSVNNRAVATKLADQPHGFDVCGQILDRGTNNLVPGYEKCE